jgi:hypothetical protein
MNLDEEDDDQDSMENLVMGAEEALYGHFCDGCSWLN